MENKDLIISTIKEANKPLKGGEISELSGLDKKTVDTGGLNIADCRVGNEKIVISHKKGNSFSQSYKSEMNRLSKHLRGKPTVDLKKNNRGMKSTSPRKREESSTKGGRL